MHANYIYLTTSNAVMLVGQFNFSNAHISSLPFFQVIIIIIIKNWKKTYSFEL